MEFNKLFDLKGKVAIVTGGGNGIGKASCLMLANAGAAVAVSDLKHEDALKVAEEIKAAGGKAIGVACNVTKDEDLVNLVEATVKELGGVVCAMLQASLQPWRQCPRHQDRIDRAKPSDRRA